MNRPLDVSGLCAGYDGVPVLHGIDLQLDAGQLVGLVGPNGSGKSTLIRALVGLQPGARGRVLIDGHALSDTPRAARSALGFAVEPTTLPPLLTGRQCIELLLTLRAAGESLDVTLALAEDLRLTPWLDRPVHSYSLGTRQKLAIVQALIGRPRLIVLDEVLNGLDPLAAYALKQALRERTAGGAAVLLATHGLEVAERLLDRALLLLDGRLVEDWDSAALAAFRADPEGGLEHAVAERLRRDVPAR